MTRVKVSRSIAAPSALVFRAVSEVARLPETNPEIVKVEVLSELQSGIGTRFRETRMQGGKELVTELEITEYRENQHLRMVADSHGTVWDTVFRIAPEGEGARLDLDMEARAHQLLPRLLNPIFKGLFRKGLARHLEAVAAYCEAQQ